MALLLGVGVIAGCSGSSADAAAEMVPADAGGSYDSGSSGAEAAADAPAAGFGDDIAAYDAAEAPADAPAEAPVGRVGQQIIRTASVTLTVEVDPVDGETHPDSAALSAAASRAARAVRALATVPDGYVSASDGYGSSVTVTLRIPSESYDSVTERLTTIGTITGRNESTEDVTGEMVDITSRITTMKASVDRLRALMSEADSMQNIIALESELSRREADLESMQRRKAELADQVALSTITVTIDAVAAAAHIDAEPAEEHSAFVDGLLAGWRGLSTVGSGLAAFIGALLPFLPVIAIVAIATLWWVRTARRRRQVLPAAATAGDALESGPHIGEVHHDADQGSQPQQ